MSVCQMEEQLLAPAKLGASRRKPVHLFALVLWTLAVLYLVANIPLSWTIKAILDHELAAASAIPVPEGPMFWRQFIVDVRATAYGAAALASFGFVIELLDGIRWAVTPEEERVAPRTNTMLSAFQAARRWAGAPVGGNTPPPA